MEAVYPSSDSAYHLIYFHCLSRTHKPEHRCGGCAANETAYPRVCSNALFAIIDDRLMLSQVAGCYILSYFVSHRHLPYPTISRGLFPSLVSVGFSAVGAAVPQYPKV